jgi:hypothetical protein
LQTLSAKHRGYGVAPLLAIHEFRVTHHESCNFVPPLFSWSYKLLFPQALSFHNHLRCPRVSPSISTSDPQGRRDEAPAQPMIGFCTPWHPSHPA